MDTTMGGRSGVDGLALERTVDDGDEATSTDFVGTGVTAAATAGDLDVDFRFLVRVGLATPSSLLTFA